MRAGVRAMTNDILVNDASTIAECVRARRVTARDVVKASLGAIARLNADLNCFTSVLVDSALQQAAEIDERLARGEDPGPLAGVPFAVKNLFDVAGLTTLAGSRIHADNPPAAHDATAV